VSRVRTCFVLARLRSSHVQTIARTSVTRRVRGANLRSVSRQNEASARRNVLPLQSHVASVHVRVVGWLGWIKGWLAWLAAVTYTSTKMGSESAWRTTVTVSSSEPTFPGTSGSAAPTPPESPRYTPESPQHSACSRSCFTLTRSSPMASNSVVAHGSSRGEYLPGDARRPNQTQARPKAWVTFQRTEKGIVWSPSDTKGLPTRHHPVPNFKQIALKHLLTDRDGVNHFVQNRIKRLWACGACPVL
jgi:hypothetical protein